jgi:hypothetical protein
VHNHMRFGGPTTPHTLLYCERRVHRRRGGIGRLYDADDVRCADVDRME